MLAAFTLLFAAVVAAGILAVAAYLGIELSKIAIKTSPPPTPLPENPALPGLPVRLICASAVCGAILVFRGLGWEDVSMATIVCVCFVACWHGAVATGKMSDYFILAPLGSIVLADVAQQNWLPLCGPLIPFLPFALTAYMSKEKSMGWDDAKLAALGGAVLGVWFALLALATACIAAAVVARLRNKTREPILFAPYMIASMTACALLTIARAN